jgi:hypothetical protein
MKTSTMRVKKPTIDSTRSWLWITNGAFVRGSINSNCTDDRPHERPQVASSASKNRKTVSGSRLPMRSIKPSARSVQPKGGVGAEEELAIGVSARFLCCQRHVKARGRYQRGAVARLGAHREGAVHSHSGLLRRHLDEA